MSTPDVSKLSGLGAIYRLAGTQASTGAIREDGVRLFWRSLVGSTAQTPEEDAVVLALWSEIASAGPELGEGVHLFEGAWELDLSVAAVRSVLFATVLAAYLILRGEPDWDIAVVSAALPFIFEIDRIELSVEDQQVVVDLTWQSAVVEAESVDDLLRAAPPAVRRRVSPEEFSLLLDRLRRAGFASDADGKVRVSSKPRTTVRIR